MKLVNEDEHGAYLGVTPDLLQEFSVIESNPNFDVFDSHEGNRRFIAVKTSRLPDDENKAGGRYGIDFNRARPELDEAIKYEDELGRQGPNWMSNIAFAAFNEEEYRRKAFAWEAFYSYILGSAPKNVWVAAHSGKVSRAPDDRMPYPWIMTDAGTAGVAASCAFNDRGRASKRTMMAVHTTGFLGAVLNLGDFGVADVEQMETVAEIVERKYHEKVQTLAGEFKWDFQSKTGEFLDGIYNRQGTLVPEELDGLSGDDAFTIRLYEKCLRLYGQEIKDYSLPEFKQALDNLNVVDVPVTSCNYLHSGRNVGGLLKLPEKIEQGLLHSAVLCECARVYITGAPELVASVILDFKREFFG